MADTGQTNGSGETMLRLVVREALWVLKFGALFGILVASVPVLARYGISQIRIGEATIDLVDKTAGKVVDVSQDLKAARAELGELRLIVDRLTAERGGGVDTALKTEIQEYRLEQTASVEKPDPQAASLAKAQQTAGLTGFMWIGNYDRDAKRWRDIVLRDRTARDYAGPPAGIVEGQAYTLDTDVNVREDWPDASGDYYSKLQALGVAAEGKKVRIVTAPRAYTRTASVDAYWARVEVAD